MTPIIKFNLPSAPPQYEKKEGSEPMQKLKNMKIKNALYLGFGITITVSLLIIAVSVFIMNSLSGGYNNILNRQVRANELVTTIRLDANIAARNVRDIALIPDDPNNVNLEARANEMLNAIPTYFDELKEVYPLKDSRVEEYEKLVNEWMNALPDILTAVHNGQISRATTLVMTDCTPKLDAMAAAAKEIDTALTAEEARAIEAQQRAVTICTIILVAATLVATLSVVTIAKALIKSIVAPVAQVHNALTEFSQGHFDAEVDFESTSELGEMCDAMRTSQHILYEVVEDMCAALGNMSHGDFDVRTNVEKLYVGRLQDILMAIRETTFDLSRAMLSVRESADQVDLGSEQVATSAQALAQGTTEQASAVEELVATIAELSEQVKRNAENAAHANDMSNRAAGGVVESNTSMNELMKAMDEITRTSEQINRIVKTIDDIAFQTNILALNAAVEAARAGAAGKGFAVVADEVRNLAAKSAEAAKSTTNLINETQSAIAKGSALANSTSSSLHSVVEKAQVVTLKIDEIAKASNEQAKAVEQMNLGIEQISSVVQAASASSEETAAASDQMAALATNLQKLLEHFTLRSEVIDKTSFHPSSAPTAKAAPIAYAPMDSSDKY